MKIIIMILIGAFTIFFQTVAFFQIKQTSNNWIEEHKGNYYERKNSQDTILIILDTLQKNVEVKGNVLFMNTYEFQEITYSKKFPPADDCIGLRFRHHPGPPLANEEYEITKSDLRNTTIVDENEKDFLFWFHHDRDLFEKTLILVEAGDWFSKKEKVEGKGVQIYTTGSCKDLIEN